LVAVNLCLAPSNPGIACQTRVYRIKPAS
jgi:hypothetical protein